MKLLPKEYLFAEGEPCDALYIVKSGTLHALRRERERIDILETFGPGSIIGDLPLKGESPRPYSVRTEETAELLPVYREKAERVILETPRWFRCLLRHLLERRKKLERRKRRYFAIHALPALLATLDYNVRISSNNILPFSTLADSLYALNGIRLHETENLCTALDKLGLFKYAGTSIELSRPTVISMLYETVRYRALHGELSPQLLNVSEQWILSTFVRAAKTGQIGEDNFTMISGLDFIKAKENKIRFSHKHIARLLERKILYLDTKGNSEDFSENDHLYGDLDYIDDLLELNRIYPELDHGLADLL